MMVNAELVIENTMNLHQDHLHPTSEAAIRNANAGNKPDKNK